MAAILLVLYAVTANDLTDPEKNLDYLGIFKNVITFWTLFKLTEVVEINLIYSCKFIKSTIIQKQSCAF